MIAPIKQLPQAQPARHWHDAFLEMVPAIRRAARIAFRDLPQAMRDEAVDEVVVNALVAYARLVELNKTDVAYPSALARYGVVQVRDGRYVGMRQNVRDVMSRYAQQKKGFKLGRLDHFDTQEGAWQEILVEDKRATPAEVAASRIDFAAWLRSLSSRRRRIAKILATGESTNAVAKQFGISPARVSQIRRDLYQIWQRFQGEDLSPARQAVPA
jgi:hypothetical protein